MAASTDQFADDYKDVQAKFGRSPFINILSTDGEPPKSYEIEYRVPGLTKNDTGQIIQAESHRVEINLPFGYPHFPPNCKPLTTVFHPDFDPDAIRIGDFWENSHSLADLIIHIGNLICFKKYSAEDVFNTEALEWTVSNSDQIPLEEIDFSFQEAVPEQKEEVEETPLEIEIEESPESPPSLEEEAEETPLEIEIEKSPEPPPSQEKFEQKTVSKPAQKVEKKEGSSNLFKIIGIGVLLVAIVMGAMIFLDIHSFSKASQHWEKVKELVDQNQFTEADRQLKAARNQLNAIKFLKKNEKQTLLQQINELSDTEKYQQGLQGKILVNGKYLTVKEQASIQELSELLAEGEKLAASSKWRQTTEVFQKALKKAIELNDSSPMPAADVKELLSRSLIKLQIDTGNVLRTQGRWSQAISSYEIALDQLEAMSEEQKSIKDTRQTWTISSFNKSIDLLEQARDNSGILAITKAGIRKKMLSASIDREEYRVTTYLKKEEYDQAVQSLQEIVSLIDKSPYAENKNFAGIRESANTRIQENRFYQIIQMQTAYLYNNYQQIFKEKFASATKSELSDPEIEFFKATGNTLIFKMMCKETIRRQKYNLEMYYQYDMQSQTWSVNQ